jgi:hypothetical protein
MEQSVAVSSFHGHKFCLHRPQNSSSRNSGLFLLLTDVIFHTDNFTKYSILQLFTLNFILTDSKYTHDPVFKNHCTCHYSFLVIWEQFRSVTAHY